MRTIEQAPVVLDKSIEGFRGQVAQIAYYLSESEGFPHGSDVSYWLAAENRRLSEFKIGITLEMLRSRIAERAYFNALREGLPSGREFDHWFEAERVEVQNLLSLIETTLNKKLELALAGAPLPVQASSNSNELVTPIKNTWESSPEATEPESLSYVQKLEPGQRLPEMESIQTESVVRTMLLPCKG
ncbi:MAG TPA: DUF2934 domain-containing protein [Fimbriimonadaceae bacterium]|jgi:hypothetical protein